MSEPLAVPNELLMMISSYVTRPRDLSRLSLACTTFHACCEARLWEDIEVELSSPHMFAILNHGGPHATNSLRFTKRLTVKAKRSDFSPVRAMVARQFVRLLSIIPGNQLQEFRWHTGGVYHASIRPTEAEALLRRHGRLRRLHGQLTWLDETFHLLDTPTTVFECQTLRHLCIHPSVRITTWHTVWQSLPNLESFEINLLDAPKYSRDWPLVDVDTPARWIALIGNPIFQKISLKRLAIRVPEHHALLQPAYVDLLNVVLQNFQFAELEHLVLKNFPGRDEVLNYIMAQHPVQRSPVTHLEITHHDQVGAPYNMPTLCNFLNYLGGLTSVKFTFNRVGQNLHSTIPMVEICRHGATLRTLCFYTTQHSIIVRPFPHWALGSPARLIETLLPQCPNLENLCIPASLTGQQQDAAIGELMVTLMITFERLPRLRSIGIADLHFYRGYRPGSATAKKVFEILHLDLTNLRVLLFPSQQFPDPHAYFWSADGVEAMGVEEVKYLTDGFEEVEGWYRNIWERGD